MSLTNYNPEISRLLLPLPLPLPPSTDGIIAIPDKQIDITALMTSRQSRSSSNTELLLSKKINIKPSISISDFVKFTNELIDEQQVIKSKPVDEFIKPKNRQSVTWGENTEHNMHASWKAQDYSETDKYDRSYNAYKNEKGYQDLHDHEYYCSTPNCDKIVTSNSFKHDGTPRMPGLTHCSNCLGYYSKDQQQSWHVDDKVTWGPIDRVERAEYYDNWNTYLAANGLPLI
jgi:hypothetical protein